MEKIADNLFNFIYPMPEFHDSFLEETEIYKKLKDITQHLYPDLKNPLENELFYCSLKIIAVQVVAKDNHGSAESELVKGYLEDSIETLRLKDLCNLIEYFGFFKKLIPDEEDDEFFKTSIDEEYVSYQSVTKIILISLLKEIEKHLIRIKSFLLTLTKSYWYKLYGAEGNYEKESINNIVSSILWISKL